MTDLTKPPRRHHRLLRPAIALRLPMAGSLTSASRARQQASVVAARGARAVFPFARAIDSNLLSGLWVQPFQKLLADMVIRRSGPNLSAGLDRP